MQGESSADSDQVYNGVRCFIYSRRGVLGNQIEECEEHEGWMVAALQCRLSTVQPQREPGWEPSTERSARRSVGSMRRSVRSVRNMRRSMRRSVRRSMRRA